MFLVSQDAITVSVGWSCKENDVTKRRHGKKYIHILLRYYTPYRKKNHKTYPIYFSFYMYVGNLLNSMPVLLFLTYL